MCNLTLEGSPRYRGGTVCNLTLEGFSRYRGGTVCNLTLEGSPRYRGGTVVQFAQVQLVFIIAQALQLMMPVLGLHE